MLKHKITTWLICLTIVAMVCVGAGDDLYVVNSLSNDVAVVDLDARKLNAVIPLGAHAFHIAFSPTGDRAFITSVPGEAVKLKRGDSGADLGPHLIVVDVARRRVLKRLPMAIAPLSTVHINPDGTRAYVVTAALPGKRNEERGRVLIVDIEKEKITHAINIGLNPLGSAMLPDGSRLFTANWASQSISVIDPLAGRVLDTIPVNPYTVRSLAVHPGGGKLYAAMEQVPVVVNAGPAQNVQLPNVLANILPQGQQQDTRHLLWAWDVNTGETARYPLGGLNPVYALAIAPDGRHAYAYGRLPQATPQQEAQVQQRVQVASSDVYDLLVIDLKEGKITQRMGNFGFLTDLLVSRDGARLYLVGTPGDPQQELEVQNYNASRVQNIQRNAPGAYANDAPAMVEDLSTLRKTITILDLKTGKVLHRIPVGSLPQNAAFPPPPKPGK